MERSEYVRNYQNLRVELDKNFRQDITSYQSQVTTLTKEKQQLEERVIKLHQTIDDLIEKENNRKEKQNEYIQQLLRQQKQDLYDEQAQLKEMMIQDVNTMKRDMFLQMEKNNRTNEVSHRRTLRTINIFS
jgi:hypothetical protein